MAEYQCGKIRAGAVKTLISSAAALLSADPILFLHLPLLPLRSFVTDLLCNTFYLDHQPSLTQSRRMCLYAGELGFPFPELRSPQQISSNKVIDMNVC